MTQTTKTRETPKTKRTPPRRLSPQPSPCRHTPCTQPASQSSSQLWSDEGPHPPTAWPISERMRLKKLSIVFAVLAGCITLVQIAIISQVHHDDAIPAMQLRKPSSGKNGDAAVTTATGATRSTIKHAGRRDTREDEGAELGRVEAATKVGATEGIDEADENETRSQSTQDDASVGNGRPRFILHIGPSKTATTTLQQDLVHLAKEGVLSEDNYMYWGRYHGIGTFHGMRLSVLSNIFQAKCMLHYSAHRNPDRFPNKKRAKDGAGKSPSSPPDCIAEVKDMLDQLRRGNQSLIVSDEAYSYLALFDKSKGLYRSERHDFFRGLQTLLEGWDVTIVVGYRRLFDWMLSCVKESNAKIALYSDNNEMKWPDQGGKPLDQPWPLMQRWYINSKYAGAKSFGTQTSRYVYIDGTIPMWQDANFTVRSLDIHDKQHITQQLLCGIISDAPHACAYLRDVHRVSNFNNRDMSWAVYNQIVFAAANRKLIDVGTQATKTRVEMTDELSHYHQHVLNKTVLDLPLGCPHDADLERFLKFSLGKELQWMPERYNESSHRAAFQRALFDRREVCSIDTATLLGNQTSWDTFLESLSNPSISSVSMGGIRYDWPFSKWTSAYPST